MASKETTLRQWLKRFDNHEFELPFVKVQIEAGWYDWFCKDTSLVNKTKNLGTKFKSISNSSKINLDSQYIFFKNNCPCVGSLYDDFRICDIKSGDVIYTIVPSSGYDSNKGTAEVYGKENDFKEPLVSGTWEDVKQYFNS